MTRQRLVLHVLDTYYEQAAGPNKEEALRKLLMNEVIPIIGDVAKSLEATGQFDFNL